MQAVLNSSYGPPEVLSIGQVDRPVPGDDDVLIRNHASTITATDVIFRRGTPKSSRVAVGLFKPKFPVPGDVFAGVVEQVGKNVTRFKAGDEVYGASGPGFGAHAEYIVSPADGAVALKPKNTDFGAAASISDGALTALAFIRDTAHVHAGQKVLVNGASGSIGSFAVQLAKNYGATVTGVCSTANVDMVRKLGADEVIDYTRHDFTERTNEYDIIFDAVGKSSFNRCKSALTGDGLYMTTVVNPTILLQKAMTGNGEGKKATITFAGLKDPAERGKDLEYLRQLAETGKMTVAIDRTYALSEIHEAHRYVESGHKQGNVVLNLV
jgi:NADPH:quinone reductase-like Zn-dependent oxidoreductase